MLLYDMALRLLPKLAHGRYTLKNQQFVYIIGFPPLSTCFACGISLVFRRLHAAAVPSFGHAYEILKLLQKVYFMSYRWHEFLCQKYGFLIGMRRTRTEGTSKAYCVCRRRGACSAKEHAVVRSFYLPWNPFSWRHVFGLKDGAS